MRSKPNDSFRDVLIVDDDPAMVRVISRFVEAEGYCVTCATDGVEALSLLHDRHFHFVLSDLDMPRMGGVELCENLRKLDLPRYVYAMILTGSQTDRLSECLIAGADDFIAKPIDRAELIARMIAGKRVLTLESQLRFLVTSDPLTDVLNRRTFFEEFEMIWRKRRESKSKWACVMADIDDFKRINDAYGHVAGDCVLRGVAEILKDVFADTGIIGRYGGEEFCIVIEDAEEATAVASTEEARKQIDEAQFTFNGIHIPVTMSFGVACRRYRTLSPIELLNQADTALLRAKRAGRNRVLAAPQGELVLPVVSQINFSTGSRSHSE